MLIRSVFDAAPNFGLTSFYDPMITHRSLTYCQFIYLNRDYITYMQLIVRSTMAWVGNSDLDRTSVDLERLALVQVHA